jgi:flagellar biosynthesis/type III secretory pathway protein FliH
MTLSQELAHTLRQELHADEAERKMKDGTSFAQIAIEEGRQIGIKQGLKEGLQQGLQHMMLRQLVHLFGALDADTQAHIRRLPLTQLEQLAEALLDFTARADLSVWLDGWMRPTRRQPAKKAKMR